MTEQVLISLGIQLPLAGLVVFLTLKFLEHLKSLHAEYQKTILQMHKESLEFAAAQADINREFLKAQREQWGDAIARLAEEIKSVTIESSKEHQSIVDAIGRIINYIEGISK